MKIITSFSARKLEKQVTYERKILRELSFEQLRRCVHEYFKPFHFYRFFLEALENGCIDVAIEAYLLGAHYSRFGYYGEPFHLVKKRCAKEEKHLIDMLFDFLCSFHHHPNQIESLYYVCEHYVASWWKEGFDQGMKRQKLRLK
jgi:hypothetical protein